MERAWPRQGLRGPDVSPSTDTEQIPKYLPCRMTVRVLLVADTHLGFDLPLTPRVARRRRGHDFLANYREALEPALSRRVDMVVHGGDLFHRARPHPTLVARAFEPLRCIADAGIPVFVVPGNHERSKIPHARFAAHPLVRIFDRPRCYRTRVGHRSVALFGFPYQRDGVRRRFPGLLRACGWPDAKADISLLCVHHCFEGATVGPSDYTFRDGADVIRCRDVPPEVTAVLTGHVHRHQVLEKDPWGGLLSTPVIYPGSTERTAFAEMGEPKGSVLVDALPDDETDRPLRWRFVELPTRPMVLADVRAGSSGRTLDRQLRAVFDGAPIDAIVRVRVHGRPSAAERPLLSAPRLRALAPPEMNVDLLFVDEPRPARIRPIECDDLATQPSLFGVHHRGTCQQEALLRDLGVEDHGISPELRHSSHHLVPKTVEAVEGRPALGLEDGDDGIGSRRGLGQDRDRLARPDRADRVVEAMDLRVHATGQEAGEGQNRCTHAASRRVRR